MELLDQLKQAGDRVRVMSGDLQGKTGVIVQIDYDERTAIVRGEGGGTRRFNLADLAVMPGENGGSPSGSTAVLEGLQGAIATLECVCQKLRTDSLTDCWIKSWKRGEREYHRLHYTVGSGKKPEYLAGEDLAVIQARINNGRKLKILRGAIVILRWMDQP